MKASAIRDRLYDYIRVADDKKIKAIYTMLEDQIETSVEWWQDDDFVKALDKEHKDAKSGRSTTYTKDEVLESIAQLRLKRRSK